MLIKTLLNRIEHFKSFVYGAVKFQEVNGSEALVVEIKARANSKPECPECGKLCKKRDIQPVRMFEYVPIWGAFKVFFQYAPRRVACPVHGVKVEYMPWAYGKEQMTTSYKVYLQQFPVNTCQSRANQSNLPGGRLSNQNLVYLQSSFAFSRPRHACGA